MDAWEQEANTVYDNEIVKGVPNHWVLSWDHVHLWNEGLDVSKDVSCATEALQLSEVAIVPQLISWETVYLSYRDTHL